jgi:hypothetical protein
MDKSDLTASRWASPEVRRERDAQNDARRRTPSPNKAGSRSSSKTNTNTLASPSKLLSSAQRTYIARHTELQRFRKLFRRLSWKANTLTHWSHRALKLAQEHQYRLGHEGPPLARLGPYEMIIDPIDTERQFKIDFYEFYALLERGLVCLLGIWGIVITASATRTPSAHLVQKTNAIIGDSISFHGSAHRFHANVLSALEHPSNPLHPVLGTGPVHAYIGVAKEFRNKWKDVEQRPEDAFRGHERVEEEWDLGKMKRYEQVLRDLKLDELLGSVLGGLHEAGRLAEGEVQRLAWELGEDGRKGLESNYRLRPDGSIEVDMQDAPFESLDHGTAGDYEMEF